MGVGRNMAYKREEFFKTNGFIEHMKIRSGDDDLFINEASNSKTQLFVLHLKASHSLNQKLRLKTGLHKKKTRSYRKTL